MQHTVTGSRQGAMQPPAGCGDGFLACLPPGAGTGVGWLCPVCPGVALGPWGSESRSLILMTDDLDTDSLHWTVLCGQTQDREVPWSCTRVPPPGAGNHPSPPRAHGHEEAPDTGCGCTGCRGRGGGLLVTATALCLSRTLRLLLGATLVTGTSCLGRASLRVLRNLTEPLALPLPGRF